MIKRRNRIYKRSSIPYEQSACAIEITHNGVVSMGPLYKIQCHKCNIDIPRLYRAGDINKTLKRGGHFYCSNMCALGKTECAKKCSWCNKEFRHSSCKNRPNRGKYCSKECYRQWQLSSDNSGEKNPNWNGGYHRDDRHQPKTRHWRTAVFKRDDYTCKKCLSRGGTLHAHHIKKWSEFPEDRYDIDNGVTLCKECHIAVHSTKDPQYIHTKAALYHG